MLRPFLVSLLTFGALTLFWRCVPPPQEPEYAGVVVDLNDATSRRIFEHQNARNADSLRAYLAHPNPSYRYLAARSLGSFPRLDGPTTDSLLAHLTDREDLVAQAAAYALGQGAGPAALPGLLAAFDRDLRRLTFNRQVLAAAGKLGDNQLLDDLTAVTTYVPTDTSLNVGQLQALFYLLRKNVRGPAGDSLVLDRLLDRQQAPEVRRWAAFYVQRAPFAAPGRTGELRALLRGAEEADLQMAAARALGVSEDPAALVALGRQLDNPDWRVRVEVLKALRESDYARVRDRIVASLRDEHPLVRRTAAAFFLAKGTPADATFYRQLARDSTTRANVRYPLYAAANRHLPLYLTDYRGRINYDLQTAFTRTSDPYERAEVVGALAEFPWNYRTLYDLYPEASTPAVRSAIAAALAAISTRADFDAFFRGSAARVRVDLSTYFRALIVGGEIGPAYHAAGALAANPDEYRPLYPDRGWLEQTLRAYELPREVEAYVAVDRARASLAGEPEPAAPGQRTAAVAIDWERIGADGGKDVVLKTSAGTFTLRVFPDAAPASVSAFLASARAGYYDGKRFHRIVPNFVAQGGGPLGDGFGSEDWYLRSETPGLGWHRPGLVGLASAGKDTEGVQFFITHRATPHLDGNYTIFGEVVAGLNVVGQITRGTVIESVRIQ